MKAALPKELLDILACPVCKADLDYDQATNHLVCVKCKHVYEVRDNIPILLPPKAGVA